MDFSKEESEKLQLALLQKPYFMRKKIQNVDNLIQKHIRNKHKSTIQVFKHLYLIRPLLKIPNERIVIQKVD